MAFILSIFFERQIPDQASVTEFQKIAFMIEMLENGGLVEDSSSGISFVTPRNGTYPTTICLAPTMCDGFCPERPPTTCDPHQHGANCLLF